MTNPYHDATGKFCSKGEMQTAIKQAAMNQDFDTYSRLQNEFTKIETDKSHSVALSKEKQNLAPSEYLSLIQQTVKPNVFGLSPKEQDSALRTYSETIKAYDIQWKKALRDKYSDGLNREAFAPMLQTAYQWGGANNVENHFEKITSLAKQVKKQEPGTIKASSDYYKSSFSSYSPYAPGYSKDIVVSQEEWENYLAAKYNKDLSKESHTAILNRAKEVATTPRDVEAAYKALSDLVRL